jgi:hypothetical protein
VTLQDGRMVRIRPGTVWQPASTDAIVPGKQIYAQGAEPVGIQAPSSASPTGWRMGIVDRVDAANGLVYLRDGSVAQVTPSTRITVNGQPIALSQVQPGAQIAVHMPVTTAVQDRSGVGGLAFPRPSPVPSPPSTTILVFP